jgi:hypothetical protein
VTEGTVKLSGLGLGETSMVGYRPSMTTSRALYTGYRYPADLISYAVWLYFRFPLSLRMVEEMLAARGVSVTYSYCVTHSARLRFDEGSRSRDSVAGREPECARDGYARWRWNSACGVVTAAADPLGR